ncbi:MAG: alpha/beta hydrolase [Acidobacteriota bacterium]|nr:alpha/beta hydrolase [Acidobacteriota bacterium]
MCRWEVPEPLATADVRTEDGTRILLRRHGNAKGPRLVLSHGNGLAIDLYYPFWSLLADRFDLVVYDFRNHGRNPLSPVPSHNVATFASDNEDVFRGITRHFGLKPWIGVFHSLSAVTILHHDPPGADASALVLFDPPIYATSGDPLEVDRMCQRFRKRTSRRQTWFEHRRHFAKVFRESPLLARLLPGVPELAGRVLLRPVGDGDGFELRCPLDYEASIYEYFFAYIYEPESSTLTCPVKVIGADPTLSFSFLPSLTLGGMTTVDYDFVPETTHYLQLENPNECAAILVRFLERRGFA